MRPFTTGQACSCNGRDGRDGVAGATGAPGRDGMKGDPGNIKILFLLHV